MEFVEIKKMYIKKENTQVYDLSVEEDTSYNINGLFVHNSAGGSLVAYLLGIHRMDPLDPTWGGNCAFERFLSEDRNSRRIIVQDSEGNKKEFREDDKINIIRNKKELSIKAIELQENDSII